MHDGIGGTRRLGLVIGPALCVVFAEWPRGGRKLAIGAVEPIWSSPESRGAALTVVFRDLAP